MQKITDSRLPDACQLGKRTTTAPLLKPAATRQTRHLAAPPRAQGAGFLGGLVQIAVMTAGDKVLPLLGRKKVPVFETAIYCLGQVEPASAAKVKDLHNKYAKEKGVKTVGPPDLAWNDVGYIVATFKFDSQATADAYKAEVEKAEQNVKVVITPLERWG